MIDGELIPYSDKVDVSNVNVFYIKAKRYIPDVDDYNLETKCVPLYLYNDKKDCIEKYANLNGQVYFDDLDGDGSLLSA